MVCRDFIIKSSINDNLAYNKDSYFDARKYFYFPILQSYEKYFIKITPEI